MLSFAAMCEHLTARRLTRHFLPEYLVFLDAMPRTPSGKVRKQDARAMALEKLRMAAPAVKAGPA